MAPVSAQVTPAVVWDVIRKQDSRAVVRKVSVAADGKSTAFSADSLSGKASYAASDVSKPHVSLTVVTDKETKRSTIVASVRAGHKAGAAVPVKGGSAKFLPDAIAKALPAHHAKAYLAKASALSRATGRTSRRLGRAGPPVDIKTADVQTRKQRLAAHKAKVNKRTTIRVSA